MSPMDNGTCAVKEKTCRAHISKVCSAAEVPEFFKELEIVTGTYVCIHTFQVLPEEFFGSLCIASMWFSGLGSSQWLLRLGLPL